jgi:uncharacterized protein
MKVAIVGASGRGGSRIVDELARRGHQVTAIARHPEKIEAQAGVTTVAGDLFDTGFSKLLSGHDAVVSAVHFSASDPRKLIEAVRAAGAKRYLVMGGAGSLEVAPGVRLIDTPAFPAAYKDEAAKGGDFLDMLRAESGLDWTFLSPSALTEPGTRTGKFVWARTSFWSMSRARATFRSRIMQLPLSTSSSGQNTPDSGSPWDIEARFSAAAMQLTPAAH